jgi:hypothetical protein
MYPGRNYLYKVARLKLRYTITIFLVNETATDFILTISSLDCDVMKRITLDLRFLWQKILQYNLLSSGMLYCIVW